MGGKKLLNRWWVKAIRWVVAWAARAYWKVRAGMMPITGGLLLLVLGWLVGGFTNWWAAPVTGAVGLAALLWFAGEQLSPHAQHLWLSLVPDSLDDGRPGVLDRPTERGYLAALVLGAGVWLSARIQYGWGQDVRLAWLILVGVAGAPWWWHRGFRRRRPLNKWARRWKRVNKNDDLKVWHGSRVVRTIASPNATTLEIALRAGLSIRKVGGDAMSLESAVNTRPGAVTVAGVNHAARHVYVRIVPRDPWKGPILHPVPPLRSVSLADNPLRVIGRYEDGSDDLFKVVQHLLVVGATGSGKSEFMQSLLAWLLAYDYAAVVAADLASGATFDVWEGVFAHPLATDVHSAMDLLWKVFALIEFRERKLAARRRAGERINVLPASEEDPALWFIIDEFPDLTKAAKAAQIDVITILERTAAKARKVNVWLILGSQNPGVADVGSTVLRGALTGTIGLGLDQQQSKNLWGTLRQEGWDSEPLNEGTYLARDRNGKHNTPRVAKGLFLTPDARADLIDRASARPTRLVGAQAGILAGMDPASAVNAQAGDSAYELNGEGWERPSLTIVRDGNRTPAGNGNGNPAAVARPGTIPGRRDSRTADLDDKVFHEVPPAHQGTIGPTDIAAQLDVSRHRVQRSLERLERAGLVRSNGDGTWSRP